jgi:hypothetical protein
LRFTSEQRTQSRCWARRSYPRLMDSEPGRRVIRREVRTTERVRHEVTVRLGSTRAVRVGVKLMFRGLVAIVRRRPVQLTLRTATTRTASVPFAEADGAGEDLLAPSEPEQPDFRLE